MLGEFVLWVQAFVEAYGLGGAFVIAVFESFIFPVPTATIIAPFTALGVDPLLITLVPFAFVIRYGVVGREERYLERKFGDSYRGYRSRVRRWL